MMTYNQLAFSAINSMNYLFLRYTFKWNTQELPLIIVEELQNYLSAFVSEPSLRFDDQLRDLLKTELIEGEYCEGLTRREAYDRYALAINKIGLSGVNIIADYYVSLLNDEDYASSRTPKDHDRLVDRDGQAVLPGMVIAFDLSISEDPIFYQVKQIGHQLFIHKSDKEPFVNVASLSPVFRIRKATDNPDYIEGWGCPRCFSDDTTTLLSSRENTCNRCGLEFPLPEEEARSMEDENTKYSLSQLTLDAQVKAYIDFLRFAEDMGHDHSHTFTEFQETSNLNSWNYSAAGQLA